MEPKTGLLGLWVLIMFLAVPCRATHGCNVMKRITFTKVKMEKLLSVYLKTNRENITCWPHPIPALDLKTPVSTEEKIQKCVCGFPFIQVALRLIEVHQKEIHNRENKIFHEINETKLELPHTEKCVEGLFHKQCRLNSTADFTGNTHYKRLQQGRTIIESSIVFMEQLVEVVESIPHFSCKYRNHRNGQLCSQGRH